MAFGFQGMQQSNIASHTVFFFSGLFQTNQQHKSSHVTIYLCLCLLISSSFPILLFSIFIYAKVFLETVIEYTALNCEIKFYLHLVYAAAFVYFEFKSSFSAVFSNL